MIGPRSIEIHLPDNEDDATGVLVVRHWRCHDGSQGSSSHIVTYEDAVRMAADDLGVAALVSDPDAVRET